MIDWPLFAALMTSGAVYWVSGKLLQKHEPQQLQVSSDILPVFDNRTIVSPFTDVHFVEFNGSLRPRLSTVDMFARKLNFKLAQEPYINTRYTGWVVECTFVNVLEHDYEGCDKVNAWLSQTYPKELFSEEQRQHPDFKAYLELKLKIDLWNYYCNKYPTALKHYAVLGNNLLENGHLR